MIEFNVNQDVLVQLTEYGRSIHLNAHNDLNKLVPNKPLPYHPPKENEDGWSRWRMWSLMELFGPHINLSGPVPFKTGIKLIHTTPPEKGNPEG